MTLAMISARTQRVTRMAPFGLRGGWKLGREAIQGNSASVRALHLDDVPAGPVLSFGRGLSMRGILSYAQTSRSVSTDLDNRIQAAVQTRRTFAIISHPDAGKTTLT